jgi:hypothetical protein
LRIPVAIGMNFLIINQFGQQEMTVIQSVFQDVVQDLEVIYSSLHWQI